MSLACSRLLELGLKIHEAQLERLVNKLEIFLTILFLQISKFDVLLIIKFAINTNKHL